MKCPRCKSEDIGPFKHEGVEFDFCSDCHGIWCGRGELANYVETIKDNPKTVHLTSEGKLTDMTCPKCERETLYEIPYLPENELLIDKCSECFGIWLDSKELGSVQKLAQIIDADSKTKQALKGLGDSRC